MTLTLYPREPIAVLSNSNLPINERQVGSSSIERASLSPRRVGESSLPRDLNGSAFDEFMVGRRHRP